MTLTIRPTQNDLEREQVFALRHEVFTIGQNVPEDLERDQLDQTAIHIIALLGDTPVGCARIRETDYGHKLERIAVLSEYRGHGYGKEIVQFMIEYCKKKNISKIYMNAQAYLQKFYEGLGFHAEGEIFEEAGIKHIKMAL